MLCHFELHFRIESSQQPVCKVLVVAYNLWMRADVTHLPAFVSQFRTLSVAPQGVSSAHAKDSCSACTASLPASALAGGAADRAKCEPSVQGWSPQSGIPQGS